MPRPFLTARWEDLVLLNYPCPVELLEPYVPAGTELDAWRGTLLVSLVGFVFRDTRIYGVPIPGHRTFEEVNLRFYVRRDAPEGARRGVVFIREVVPRRMIAATARRLYHEPYVAMPMSRSVALDPVRGGSATYTWTDRGAAHTLSARVRGPAEPLTPGSEAEFITEHYWGYNQRPDGSTLEYRVAHPSWRVWASRDARYTPPGGAALYGPDFAEVLAAEPASAFVAVGSDVEVYRGVRLPSP